MFCLRNVGTFYTVSGLLMFTGVVRPQQLTAVTSGIAFHPLSASLAAAATRPGFYFAAQPGAAMPSIVTSAGIIPATSLASGTVVRSAGVREAGTSCYEFFLNLWILCSVMQTVHVLK